MDCAWLRILSWYLGYYCPVLVLRCLYLVKIWKIIFSRSRRFYKCLNIPSSLPATCFPISKSMKPKKLTQFFLQRKFHCDEESNGVLSSHEPKECCFLYIANDTSGLTKSKMGNKYPYDAAERTVNVLFLECHVCGKALNLREGSLTSNVIFHI